MMRGSKREPCELRILHINMKLFVMAMSVMFHTDVSLSQTNLVDAYGYYSHFLIKHI